MAFKIPYKIVADFSIGSSWYTFRALPSGKVDLELELRIGNGFRKNQNWENR